MINTISLFTICYYTDIALLLIIYSLHYISYTWLIYSVPKSLYLLVSLTYFSISFGNHLFVHCIYIDTFICKDRFKNIIVNGKTSMLL